MLAFPLLPPAGFSSDLGLGSERRRQERSPSRWKRREICPSRTNLRGVKTSDLDLLACFSLPAFRFSRSASKTQGKPRKFPASSARKFSPPPDGKEKLCSLSAFGAAQMRISFARDSAGPSLCEASPGNPLTAPAPRDNALQSKMGSRALW